MPDQSFLHLRVHSAFSLSEGAFHVDEIAKRAKALGMPAVALTDTHNLFGALAFANACTKQGVQPIHGCQLSLHLEEMGQPAVGKKQTTLSATFPLYAKTLKGYQNLMKLSSQAYRRAWEDGTTPHITWEDLEGHTEDLIALTGNFPYAGKSHGLHTEHLNKLLTLFPDHLYVELSRQGEENDPTREALLIDWAYEKNVPLIATNEAFFPEKEMAQAHEALLCIADGTYVTSQERRRSHRDYAFKSSEEMAALFADVPEALANTYHLAKRCSFILKGSGPIMPVFPTEKGEEQELKDQAWEGLDWRFETFVKPTFKPEDDLAEIRKSYDDRLQWELDIIIQMGFPGYFLIVSDFIKWAKDHDIPVGPGRGSGAGSLVAWSLKITDVDPIQNELIFERFLNPERVSMPDFDVDFCQERRDEVIHYVQEKYGHDRVAQIITFGKLQAKAVIRDVGRVLQMPYGQVDRLSKLVPFNPANPISLGDAIEQEPELQKAQDEEPEVDYLLKIALQLEGLYRHASTHAAGIVIGKEPLETMVPLYYDPRSDMPATQYNMKDVEKVGQVKFDFLGLKTLTVISTACQLLRQRDIEVDISKIPLDDKTTFDLFKRVETYGVFQLESGGMRDVLRQLQPNRFEEIIALVALYRPGPMDDIPRYLACKHGDEEVTYLHPMMESILAETFGVMVYQEQVMQIAQKLGGYSLGAADLLRRAMGKKIVAEMDAQRKIFVEGCAQNKIDEPLANKIFDVMAKFAGYGFNKCHSTPYALIAYQTAYLKANYPVEFMAASMTLELNNTDKLNNFKNELQRMSVPLLPPDVNTSGALFRVEKTAEGELGVRYALGAIKNVGESAMEALVQEREANGPFKDITDFATRVDAKVCNKRLMENLIFAGAFDNLHENRHELLANLERILRFADAARQDKNSQQVSLFGGGDSGTSELHKLTLTPTAPWKSLEKLNFEFGALGFYLSDHPLSAFQNHIAQEGMTEAAKLPSLLPNTKEGKTFTLAGVVLTKQEKASKTGNKYAFVQLSDPSGVFEVTVFSEMLMKYREILEPGSLIVTQVSGRLEEETPRLTVLDIESLSHYSHKDLKTVRIRFLHQQALPILKTYFGEKKAKPGGTQVWLSHKNPQGGILFKLPQTYDLTLEDVQNLEQMEMFDEVQYQM